MFIKKRQIVSPAPPVPRESTTPPGIESAIESLMGALREATPLATYLRPDPGLERELQELGRHVRHNQEIPYGVGATAQKAEDAIGHVRRAEGGYRELLESARTALTELFPLAAPGFVLGLWRGEPDADLRRSLLAALPAPARRALSGDEVLALLPEQGPVYERALWWLAPFLEGGATGVPDADVLIFRRLGSICPALAAPMLGSVPGIGVMLSFDEIAALLESPDATVRSAVVQHAAGLAP
jgi:hypothetical protein